MSDKYDHKEIEKKWQESWKENGIYNTSPKLEGPKSYVLDMFPYPSGEGLHVGHPKGYIATDIYSRMKKMSGFNVLHPMGWDAFGLPAENFAIKNKIHPRVAVEKNIKRFKEQLDKIGFNYDWEREINTTDPEYYKWTQWIFLKLLEKGLAYESYEPINWCPSCQTGLANEDLESNGTCERCGSVVEKRPMRQWILKITEYADRMLEDLDMIVSEDGTASIDKINDEPCFTQILEPGKLKPEMPFVERNAICAIVKHWKEDKYIGLKWKKVAWKTLITGGQEDGQTIEEAAKMEIMQETGYQTPIFKKNLGKFHSKFFHVPKNVNRFAHFDILYFELQNSDKKDLSDEESSIHELVWLTKDEMSEFLTPASHKYAWSRFINPGIDGVPGIKKLVDWPEYIKESQRNWIGKSEGMLFTAPVKDTDLKIQTFSAHFEAFAADTFVVIAPDHPFLKELVKGTKQEKEVLDFAQKLVEKRLKAGYTTEKESEGIFTGRYIVDPVGNGDLPIWVASFALADYGTGIVKCSAHDERDFAFAKKYNIKLKPVLFPSDPELKQKVKDLEICYTDMKNGVLSEPNILLGKTGGESREVIVAYLENNKLAQKKTTYKLKDWVFSRQRYWGEPIPVVHCSSCGTVPVPEKDLPVKLPEVENYEPTGTGESPLANITEWVNTTCPKCGGSAKRETNTMPQWAGSSWYYLRYIDPQNNLALVDKEKEKYWMPVDMYVGGAEHATRHLIYARFWHKFLFDLGFVNYTEPFQRLQNVGLILAEDGRKMSKRYGNVINPDDIVDVWGADSLRLYEMFMGPFSDAIAWNTDNMIGVRRFLERVWKLQKVVNKNENVVELDISLHKTIKKVTEDIEGFKFNTAISAMMIFLNGLDTNEKRQGEPLTLSREIFEKFLKLLAPFAPHMTEELWHRLGNQNSIHLEKWPDFDESKITEERVVIVVQVNGRVRAQFEADSGISENEAKNKAFSIDEVKKWIEGKEINRVIFVPNKILNIVLV